MKTLRLNKSESAAYANGERRFWRAMRKQPDQTAIFPFAPCPYGTLGDRLDVSRYYPEPPFRLIQSFPITAITVEQQGGKWGWVIEVCV